MLGTGDKSLGLACSHVNASLSVLMVSGWEDQVAEVHATRRALKLSGGEGALKMRCKIVIPVS